jgi:6-phosphogluconate dehydrogenase
MIIMKTWKYFDEAEFIWNGAWSDPELKYKGCIINSHIIEDTIWDRFNEYAEEENIQPTEENFTIYCNDNKEDIRELFEIAIGNEI